jgi:hypothetical protein
MAFSPVRLCGGRLIVEFDVRSTATEGGLAVTLSGRRTLWDGEEVAPVVAEALALAWRAAEDGD